MVGEIRDAETARIAIESALTGHMVLSTLHTNDAPGTITRLQKMGIESFLTASALDCVVAQRLARKLCTHCKRRTLISQAALLEAGFRVGTDLEAYEPVGCGRCNQSGLPGPDRDLLGDADDRADQGPDRRPRRPRREITAAAREEGMLTLREEGLSKVRAGRHLDRRARPRRHLIGLSAPLSAPEPFAAAIGERVAGAVGRPGRPSCARPRTRTPTCRRSISLLGASASRSRSSIQPRIARSVSSSRASGRGSGPAPAAISANSAWLKVALRRAAQPRTRPSSSRWLTGAWVRGVQVRGTPSDASVVPCRGRALRTGTFRRGPGSNPAPASVRAQRSRFRPRLTIVGS